MDNSYLIELAKLDYAEQDKAYERKMARKQESQQMLGGAVNIASSFIPGGSKMSAIGDLFGR